MKIIIAGSRGIEDSYTQAVLSSFFLIQSFVIDEIVSGTARGVDQSGEAYALRKGISIKKFPADWDTYGKRAGYIRNEQMADYADALVAIWDGESRGTKHMIDIMKKANKPFWIIKP